MKPSALRGAILLLALSIPHPLRVTGQHSALKHPAAAPHYILVPAKSKIQFFVRSTLSDVNGAFQSWQGSLKIPNPGTVNGISLRLDIAAASMTTGNGVKDGVIKGKDFFYVEQYPAITFVSTKVIATGDPKSFRVEGNFTLRGVTKPVMLDVKLAREGTVQGLIHGDLSFDRRDFGMTKDMPFNKVADTVKVTLDVDVERAAGTIAN